MTITVQRLLTELGNRAWSGFNKDDMVFANADCATALAELNSAHRYLQSLKDFPFQTKINEIITIKDGTRYPMRNGQIKSIINSETFAELEEVEKPNLLKDATGTPDSFYIDYTNPTVNIVLYPKPNASGLRFNVIYNNYKFILDKNGNELDEFTHSDDILNMPSYLEFLYMDCLVLRTMVTNNKDEQDENYRPTINEFEQAWKNFLRKVIPTVKEIRMII